MANSFYNPFKAVFESPRYSHLGLFKKLFLVFFGHSSFDETEKPFLGLVDYFTLGITYLVVVSYHRFFAGQEMLRQERKEFLLREEWSLLGIVIELFDCFNPRSTPPLLFFLVTIVLIITKAVTAFALAVAMYLPVLISSSIKNAVSNPQQQPRIESAPPLSLSFSPEGGLTLSKAITIAQSQQKNKFQTSQQGNKPEERPQPQQENKPEENSQPRQDHEHLLKLQARQQELKCQQENLTPEDRKNILDMQIRDSSTTTTVRELLEAADCDLQNCKLGDFIWLIESKDNPPSETYNQPLGKIDKPFMISVKGDEKGCAVLIKGKEQWGWRFWGCDYAQATPSTTIRPASHDRSSSSSGSQPHQQLRS